MPWGFQFQDPGSDRNLNALGLEGKGITLGLRGDISMPWDLEGNSTLDFKALGLQIGGLDALGLREA
jgi:hypothetical protein